MLKPLVFSLLLFLAAAPLWSAETDLATDSANWPFNVLVLPDKLEGLSPALSKYQGVLLRIEENGEALVDFGRDGIHRLALERTDIPVRAAALRSGSAVKEMPNFARYTANSYFHKTASGTYGPIPVDVFEQNAFCLLAYGDARLVDDNILKAALDKLHADALDKGGILVVLPTEHAFYSRAAAERIDWAMFSPHMSIAFRGTLQHEPAPNVLTFVAVDLDGRVLGRWSSPYAEATAALSEVGDWIANREKPADSITDEGGLRRKSEADAKARADLEKFKIAPAK